MMCLCLQVSSGDSYIQGCAFHDGFSPAIGVFGTEGLNVDDNVIHRTVGEGEHNSSSFTLPSPPSPQSLNLLETLRCVHYMFHPPFSNFAWLFLG